ncbi:MAG: hypothetical protein NTX87_15085 [Planctomycetota bacterium]|nr:hypothetical protein [Planctomycetota bacterium]
MTLMTTPCVEAPRPSRRIRALGVYFSVLTGLPWLAMLLLLATLVPRLERVLAEFRPRGGLPAITTAAIGLSHAVEGWGAVLATMVLAAALFLALACGRGRSRRIIIATIVSGSLSVAIFFVFVVLLFMGLYGPLVLLVSRAAGHS